MCGIVGYIGARNAAPLIVNGLKRLEYRGYDSAGIAVLDKDVFALRKDSGKLARLIELLERAPVSGLAGIGHTRWATHGAPNTVNAHPHAGTAERVVVVQNGIVENHLELRAELEAAGVVFRSDTDTETICHLLERHMDAGADFETAARRTFQRLRGANVILAMAVSEPDRIVAARIGNAGGLVLGLGSGENFIASDLPALLEHTRDVMCLDSQQFALVSRDGIAVSTLDGAQLQPPVQKIDWDPAAAEKDGYPHFMLKEIHEQARALTNTLAGRADFDTGRVRLAGLGLTPRFARNISRLYVTACGTAACAGMVGKYLFERLARIPTEVVIASEFRYGDPVLDSNTVVLAISQSGETVDTLAAMEEAKRKGAKVWCIVNAMGSQAQRIADGCIPMQAGPEIGVASTKAFTAPLLDQYMLALLLAELRGTLAPDELRTLVADLRAIPALVGETLAREPAVVQVAGALAGMSNCLYLGRGISMPVAYEGALKLKELSYVHAEAYPGGEMKHGPIALVDAHLPVICLAPRDPWHDKMLSQVQQVKARGGTVVAVASDGDELASSLADHVLRIPAVPWLLSPVISVLPLQLLAYHVAAARGLDVDQPRNLAKSVTVE